MSIITRPQGFFYAFARSTGSNRSIQSSRDVTRRCTTKGVTGTAYAQI